MSYQASIEQAVANAGRFLKEAGAAAVKLEGGAAVSKTIQAISSAGITDNVGDFGTLSLLPIFGAVRADSSCSRSSLDYDSLVLLKPFIPTHPDPLQRGKRGTTEYPVDPVKKVSLKDLNPVKPKPTVMNQFFICLF